MTSSLQDESSRLIVPSPAETSGEGGGRNLLMISYNFPPAGGGGVQRVCKMARYLPHYGWIPRVLTVDGGQMPVEDRGLLEEIPETVTVHRVEEAPIWRRIFDRARSSTVAQPESDSAQNGSSSKGLLRPVKTAVRGILHRLRDHFLIPDEQIIWRVSAVREALAVIDRYPVDAVFSTYGPATNHLVGLDVVRETGLPWVADFRDPWVGNLHFEKLPAHRRRREGEMQRQVVEECGAVTTVTRAFASSFLRRYAPEQLDKVALIYNGLDPDDYRDLSSEEVESERMVCVYAGALYPKRSPALLLRAVGELIDRGVVDPESLRLAFCGIFDYPGHSENRDLVEQLGLGEVVEVLGHLTHRRALALMAGADALLMVGDSHPRAGEYIPGKVYEYMALGKPVVGTMQPGEGRQLLQRYNRALLSDPQDFAGVTANLQKLYGMWQQGNLDELSLPDPSGIPRRFHRDHQAGQLAKILDGLIT